MKKKKKKNTSVTARASHTEFYCDLDIEDHLPANMQPADSGGQICSRDRIKGTFKKKKMVNCLVVETAQNKNKKRT